jgi:glycosyltransferase involved in cell wall biosynthesis
MVSIIIPYYNRISDVSRAVDSVFSQSYVDWELFLIDDCSIESSEILTQYTKGPNGQRVHHRSNTNNMGPGYSRNRGIKEAVGEYLVFLDSDDVLNSRYLEKMVSEMAPDLLFVYCSAAWKDGSIYKNSSISFNIVLPTLFEYGRPWPTVSILWNKMHIPYFNERLRAWEDYLFEFEAGLKYNKIRHLNEILVTIGQVDNLSLSSLAGTSTGWIDNILAIDEMFVLLESRGLVRNLKLVKLLLIRHIHFYTRLISTGSKKSIYYKSKILKMLPNNVFVLKILKKCLGVF